MLACLCVSHLGGCQAATEGKFLSLTVQASNRQEERPATQVYNTAKLKDVIFTKYSEERPTAQLYNTTATLQVVAQHYNTKSIVGCQERPAASGEPIFPMQFRRNL